MFFFLLFVFPLFSSFFPRFVLAQERAPEIRSQVVFNGSRYGTLTLKALKGKVVLLFFWTAHDITCQQAIGRLNAWYAAYAGRGLEIVGVYAPEWGTRVSQSRLSLRIERLGVKFPVIVDDEGGLRSAYGLLAWPSCCLIDRSGYIRLEQNGALDYAGLKVMLKTLLEEKG